MTHCVSNPGRPRGRLRLATRCGGTAGVPAQGRRSPRRRVRAGPLLFTSVQTATALHLACWSVG